MFTTIPESWRADFGNLTMDNLKQLNDTLVLLHIPAIVIIAVLMVAGVLGNILVLYIYKQKYEPSVYRSFILWLGSIDVIACAVGMPLLIISMVYPYMFPSEQTCKTLRFLHVFFVVSSAFIVIAIAIERHRKICNVFSPDMTPRKIKVICFIASVLGCLIAVPSIFIYGNAVVKTGVGNVTGTECFVVAKYETSRFAEGYFMFQLLLSVVSMILLGIFYFRIWLRIKRHRSFIRRNTASSRRHLSNPEEDNNEPSSTAETSSRPQNETSRRSRQMSRSRSADARPSRKTKQVTFTLFVITVVFVLSFIPHLVLMVIISKNRQFVIGMSTVGVVFYNIGLRSFVINNMANPIIYGFCDQKFRSECSKLLALLCRCTCQSDAYNVTVN